jgi:hypothetical protein
MEILQENAIKIIRENCSPNLEISLFKDHIIISLPVVEGDFRASYLSAKKQIAKCIQQHLPDREEELLYEVRNNSWNCGFKIGR